MLTWWESLSWPNALMVVGTIFGVLCIILGTWPRARNRLNAPDVRCKRPGPQAVP